jgi:HlyD family secretion protein
MRERLVRELKLTDEQQKKLDPILEDSRAQYRGLAGGEGAERQAQATKIREATRVRIREILTPEQQALYDQSTAARGAAGGGGTPGRVWIVGPDGAPKQVNVTLGLSDGSSTEILRGDLKDGQDVIVGLAGVGPARPQSGGGTQPGSGPRLRL